MSLWSLSKLASQPTLYPVLPFFDSCVRSPVDPMRHFPNKTLPTPANQRGEIVVLIGIGADWICRFSFASMRLLIADDFFFFSLGCFSPFFFHPHRCPLRGSMFPVPAPSHDLLPPFPSACSIGSFFMSSRSSVVVPPRHRVLSVHPFQFCISFSSAQTQGQDATTHRMFFPLFLDLVVPFYFF